MSDQRNGGIAWTDETWNPIRGCSRVSAGCDSCYAMQVAYRFKGEGLPYEGLATLRKGKADWTGIVRTVPEHLADPLRWRRPRRVFVNSMSDLFHESIPFETIAAIFGIMGVARQHTFQVLTKRPRQAARFFSWLRGSCVDVDPDLFCQRRAYSLLNEMDQKHELEQLKLFPLHKVKRTYQCWPWPYLNVHLGVSTEDQATADKRIPLLLELPAAVRFISAEPLLDALDLEEWLTPLGAETCSLGEDHAAKRCNCRQTALNWVIVGGESGADARPFDLGWARSIVEQCKAAGVACFVKQMGSDPIDGTAGCSVPFASKSGSDPNEWPLELRVQEFPK